MEVQKVIDDFVKKFNAKIIIPWDGKVMQVELPPNRVTICARVTSLPQGTEFVLRPKNLPSVLERDVWDINVLLSAGLIEQHLVRTIPQGLFRSLDRCWTVYPTGVISVDLALYTGGFYGRIVSRIWGASTGGKSVILHLAMITAWRYYRKRSLIINPEYDFDESRFRVLPGGNEVLENNVIDIYEPGSGEDAYDKAINMVSSGDYAIVGVDSLTPLTSESELDKGMRLASKVADKARMQTRFIEDVLPHLYHQSQTALILVVQSRSRISTQKWGGFESNYEASGGYAPGGERQAAGNALQFYSQQSLKVNAPMKVQYDTQHNIVGHLITGIVDKNKHAPQGRKFQFYIDYTNGVDCVGQLIVAGINCGVIRLDKTAHIIDNMVVGKDLVFKNNKACWDAIAGDFELERALHRSIIASINPNYRG